MLRARLSSTTLLVFSLLLALTILPVPTLAQTTDDASVYKAVVEHFRRDDAFIRFGWQGPSRIEDTFSGDIFDDLDDEERRTFFYWATPLLTRDVARELRSFAKQTGISRNWLVQNRIVREDELVPMPKPRPGESQDGVETDSLAKGCRWFFSKVARRDDLAFVFVNVWCGRKSSMRSAVILRMQDDGWRVVDVAWLLMS